MTCLFVKFWENVPCSFFEILKIFEISKFRKSELGNFIPNFPLKQVITSTNDTTDCNRHCIIKDTHREKAT